MNNEINENDGLELPDIEDVQETGTQEEPQEVEETLEIQDEVDQEEIQDLPEDLPQEQETEDLEEDDSAIAFYEMLQERGIAPEGKEVKNWNDIDSIMDEYNTTIPQKVREDMLSQTPELGRNLVDYILTKGTDLSVNDLKSFYDDHLEDQSRSEISDRTDARSILTKEYTKTMNPKVVEVMLDTMEDEGILIEEANKFNKSKTDQILQSEKANRQAAEQQQMQFLSTVKEEFDSQPWEKSHIEKVKQSFLDGSLGSRIDAISTNPKALVQLVNILNYYDDETNTFNLDTFFNKAQTGPTNNYRERIKRGLQNRGNSVSHKNKNSQGENLENLEIIL